MTEPGAPSKPRGAAKRSGAAKRAPAGAGSATGAIRPRAVKAGSKTEAGAEARAVEPAAVKRAVRAKAAGGAANETGAGASNAVKVARAKAGADARSRRRASSARTAPEPAPEGPAPAIPYSPEAVAEIFRRLAVQRPHPTTELEHVNTFTLLVAVVLSAQMTDAGVNRATRTLFAHATDPAAMAALGAEAIRDMIANVGFANTKARNVQRLSEILRDEHGGRVPDDRAALEALPGVGRKTASVILNTAFGRDTLAVDTHIFRVGNRLKLAPGRTPEAVEAGFRAIVPDAYLSNAHHWLLLHGRYVCKARKPDCGLCVIADLCRADEKWNAVAAPLVPLPVTASGPQAVPTLRAAG